MAIERSPCPAANDGTGPSHKDSIRGVTEGPPDARGSRSASPGEHPRLYRQLASHSEDSQPSRIPSIPNLGVRHSGLRRGQMAVRAEAAL